MARDDRVPGSVSLPDDYTVVWSPAGVLAVHRDYAAALEAAGFGPDQDGGLAPSDLAGRRPLLELSLGEERLVVRVFRRGGLFRWLGSERFLAAGRPFRELVVSHGLARRGIATPLIVAARARRAPVLGWRLSLVSRRIEDAVDATHLVDRLRARSLPPARRASFVRAFGGFVGRLHHAGLHHTDLTPRNVLVDTRSLEPSDQGEPSFWVLDLDRCRLASGPLDDRARSRTLWRLLRYVLRRDGATPTLSATDLRRFLEGYRGGLASDGFDWKTEWRRIDLHRRSSTFAHRLGWWVEESFGGGPETRDGRGLVAEDPTS